MREFNKCIEDSGMLDVPTSGAAFTWWNDQCGSRKIWQRLDQVLQSGAALFRGGFSVAILHQECFDHAPILCSWDLAPAEGLRRWRYLWAWCMAEGYSQCVKDAWASSNLQSHVYNLHMKLKAIRYALIRWNRDFFGNIFDWKAGIEVEVGNIESLVRDWNQVDFTC